MRQNIETQIDLTRTTPPMPAWVGKALEKTLSEIGQSSDSTALLRNHHFAGFLSDREAGSKWLQPRFDQTIDPARITVTNGTQNALVILLAQLVGRDGLLFTEELTYHGLHAHARLLGFTIQGLAMDDDGLRPDAFEDACRKHRPNALFLMPVLQNPTTAIMPESRRWEIIAIARHYGLPIIEDDVYGMLPTNAPPPISALAPDVGWYAAGLAKTVATGLRVSYLVSPSESAAQKLIEPYKLMSTWFVAPLSAAVAAQWIADGTARRLLRDIRTEAAERQSIAKRVLVEADVLTKPESIHLWLRLPNQWPRQEFLAALKRSRVSAYGSEAFAADSRRTPNAVRITIGKPTHRAEVETGLEVIARTLAERAKEKPVRELA